MSMERQTAKADEPVVGRGALWFGLLGGGVAWALHFLTAYVLAEFGWVSGWGRSEYLGVTFRAWMLLGVSLLMVLGAGTATFVAWRSRRLMSLNSSQAGNSESEAARYMARAGYITSAMFLFIILVESVPIFFFLQDR
jgi:hypothetical protein